VLWVILGVLVVALIGTGAFLLTSGDDDDGDETSTRDRRETSSTTEADDGGGDITVPTLPDDGGSGGDTGGSGGGDAATQLAEDIYSNTPAGVDQEESLCIAGRIVEIVGEGMVADAGYDYQNLYGQTSTSQDDQIATGIYPCTDVSDDEDLANDDDWPTAWVPRSS
jgi:hypothetical protein